MLWKVDLMYRKHIFKQTNKPKKPTTTKQNKTRHLHILLSHGKNSHDIPPRFETLNDDLIPRQPQPLRSPCSG